MFLDAGDKLGVYEIIQAIGEGGMGTVYRARDTALGRNVAIKVLRKEFAADADRLRRFEKEARSASALNHPNIIHIYVIGEHEGTRFIAMEYVEGRSLRDLLRDGPLPTKKILDIATQIATGLVKAHSAGIVHRDLKPENLMVTDDGYVKILDFGLAKLVREAAPAGSKMVTQDHLSTRQGVVVGTVQYMSPEQASGRKVDAHSDQFAFGSILYEMATGKLAFRRASIAQTMAAIIEDEPEPIQNLNPKVPVELAAIVERCLSKDPSRRYESTGNLARSLKNIHDASPSRRERRNSLYVAAAVVAAILTLGLGMNLGRLWDWVSPRATRAPIESIAVLPLNNLSDEPEQDYFADGMTEALITDLAKSGALKVISRTSAMRYKDSDKALSDIASELNVDAVIEGSAIRVGDRVRITAQLIDPRTEQALWAESYERSFRDLLKLQSEVARAVAREIEMKVTPEATPGVAGARQLDPEAHDAYLKGRFHYYRLTPTDLGTALSYFQLALQHDPTFAPAHVGIARVWIARQQIGLAPAPDATPLAKASTLKALELDESLGEAHSALAVLERNDWDWASAEREYERAIELNPNDADTRADYSHLLTIMRRPDDAIAQIERALELDPFNAYLLVFYGVDLVFARRYDDAIAQFREALKTSPNFPLAASNLSHTLHLKRDYEQALAVEKANRAARGDRESEEALTRGFEEAGYTGAMRHLAETLAARSRKTHTGAVRTARYYLRSGDTDLALEWLERAFQDRDPNLPYAVVAPSFDSVRHDARFQDLLRRLNLPG